MAPNFRPTNHLMIGEKALVAAEPHHRERRHGVEHAPHRQRHRRDDRRRHQRAGRDERARDEVAPDDEVEEEGATAARGSVIAPAFDQRGAGGQLPARGAFGDRELDDDAGDKRPHQREPVLGAGDRGRHHVADADAGGGEQEPGADVGELHEVGGIVGILVVWWLVDGGCDRGQIWIEAPWTQDPLLADHQLRRLVVLVADELDQLASIASS